MTTPIIAIHGVNNRHRPSFEQTVAFFNDKLNEGQSGTRWRVYPVWWGDLGARDSNLKRIIPDPGRHTDAASESPSPAPANQLLAQAPDPNATFEAARTAASAALTNEDSETEMSQATVRAVIDESLRSAWRSTAVLQFATEAVAANAGRRIGDALQRQQPKDVAAASAAVFYLVREADDGLLERIVAGLNRVVRRHVIEWASRFFGDVVVYSGDSGTQSRPTGIPVRFNETLATLRAECGETWGTAQQPISVVGHSLGSLIALDAAARAEDHVSIATFITFGSQASWFHAIRPRGALARYDGIPVPIPTHRIKRWVNIWNPDDPLAFLMRPVFRAPSTMPEPGPGERVVEDVRGPADLSDFHGMYWRDPTVVGIIRDALAAADA